MNGTGPESLANWLWRAGVLARDAGKWLGVSGPLEPLLTHLGPRLLPPPREEVVLELDTGVRLAVPPKAPSYRNFAAGTYERALGALFPRLVASGQTVVDLGASIGYHTLAFAALVGPGGCVHAFEPDPLARAFLERNLELNGCVNVCVWDLAVADRSGEAGFCRCQVERGFLCEEGWDQRVRTIALDDHFAALGWPPVHLVKMDIEGGEAGALAGMGQLCRRNPDLLLVMEYNLQALGRAGVSPPQLRSLLLGLGFQYAWVVERGCRYLELERGLPRTSAMYNLLLSRRPLDRLGPARP